VITQKKPAEVLKTVEERGTEKAKKKYRKQPEEKDPQKKEL